MKESITKQQRLFPISSNDYVEYGRDCIHLGDLKVNNSSQLCGTVTVSEVLSIKAMHT